MVWSDLIDAVCLLMFLYQVCSIMMFSRFGCSICASLVCGLDFLVLIWRQVIGYVGGF